MGTTAIIFLVLMVVVTGFTAVALICELASSSKQDEPKSENATTETTLTDATIENAATQVDETPVVTAPTHQDKYDALSDDARSLYDEIAAYAAAVDGAQSKMSKSCEQFAIGSKKIVRLSIKNDVVVCSFSLRNINVFAHEGENKIMISTASITTKITDSERVSAAKNTIDMVVRSINDEKELKSRLASEKRKQKTVQTDNGEDDVE